MRVLLLGVGMQGKTALHDLCDSDGIETVVAADIDLDALLSHVANLPKQEKVACERVDASHPESLARLMRQGFDVIIDLLPAAFIDNVVQSAVDHGVHFINTMHATPLMTALASEAEEKGIVLLPGLGMDPGIDQVMLGQAVRLLDRVTELSSYGSGIPAPEAANNPIKYKVSWTFDGVLELYRRPARLIRDGVAVEIPGTEILSSDNIHVLEIADLGPLEAYGNGDFLSTIENLGLDPVTLTSAGQYTLRWPGHCEFWRKIVDLHLLDKEPVIVDGQAVDRKRYLVAALEPHLQYGEGEQDMAILRVEAAGTKDGAPTRVVLELIDRRDLETGLTAMSRLVGFTASIGAQMIGNGDISRRGLLSPARDVPYQAFTEELGRRGIEITSSVSSSAQPA